MAGMNLGEIINKEKGRREKVATMTRRNFPDTEIEFFLTEGRADDLVHVVVDGESGNDRDRAAAKLIEMWENDRQNGVTLDHLVFVGDHADEPHKSQVNQIIRDNI